MRKSSNHEVQLARKNLLEGVCEKKNYTKLPELPHMAAINRNPVRGPEKQKGPTGKEGGSCLLNIVF
jgi:hypothetical protein